MDARTAQTQTAQIYRMETAEHHCPFGLKSLDLLQRKGFEVEDHPLRSREETDAFMQREGVKTTPQTYIDGKRIGGYEELRDHFGLAVKDEDEVTYMPVIALFAVAFAMALAIGWRMEGAVASLRTFEIFVATAMVLLGLQKLKDVESFSTMFLNYDLLARRWVPYGYVYPFAETLAGVLMLASALIWFAGPVALFIGTVGAISVFKAVYIEKRELKCACVGGDSNVPLGFVSLTENLIMMGMGLWMPFRVFVLQA